MKPAPRINVVTSKSIISNTSWILTIAYSSGNDIQTAESYCAREFDGSIRTFDTYPTTDSNIWAIIGNGALWNGYIFSTPLLKNLGRFVILFHMRSIWNFTCVCFVYWLHFSVVWCFAAVIYACIKIKPRSKTCLIIVRWAEISRITILIWYKSGNILTRSVLM